MTQINEKQIKLNQGSLIVGDSNNSGDLISGNQNQVPVSDGTNINFDYISDLRDSNGLLILEGLNENSPVNWLQISNSNTGNDIVLSSNGNDTNINIKIEPSGTGTIRVPSTYIVSDQYDLTTKTYVDTVAQGLDFKNSVRVATQSPLGGSYTYDNSTQTWSTPSNPVVDGVSLADGDRLLIKSENDPGGNDRGHGIWTYNASVPTFERSDDAGTGDLSGGAFVFVEEGSAADSGWVLSQPNGDVNIGTDDILFVQFSEAGITQAGEGLTKTDTTLDVNYDNTTIFVNSNDDLAVKSSNSLGQVLVSDGSLSDANWGFLSDLYDTNGEIIIEGVGSTTPVNYFQVSNSDSGDAITLKTLGTDTNINMLLEPQGNGQIIVKNGYQVVDDFSVSTKDYVDNKIGVLLLKKPVKASTTEPLGNIDVNFVYNPLVNDFWDAPDGGFTIDGVTISDGERILVKNEGNPGGRNRGHGIWEYDDTNNRLFRPDDANNTTNNKLRSGLFLFVQRGTINGDTGWCISDPNDNVTLGVDDINFIQFSEAGITQAGVALNKTNLTFNLDIPKLSTTSVENNDTVAFYDQSSNEHAKTTVFQLFQDAQPEVIKTTETIASGAVNETFINFFSVTPYSDDGISVFFNGIKLNSNSWTRSGQDLTLVDSNIGYSTESGDVISARFEIKI